MINIALIFFYVITLIMIIGLLYNIFFSKNFNNHQVASSQKDQPNIQTASQNIQADFKNSNFNFSDDLFVFIFKELQMPAAIFDLNENKFVFSNLAFEETFNESINELSNDQNLRNYLIEYQNELKDKFKKLEFKTKNEIYFDFNKNQYKIKIAPITCNLFALIFNKLKEKREDIIFDFLNVLADNLNFGIILINKFGEVLIFNKIIKNLFCFSSEEVKKKKLICNFFSKDNIFSNLERFKTNFLNKSFPEIQEYYLTCKDDKDKWLRIFYNFIKIENEEHLLLCIFDITIEKDIQEKLKEEIWNQVYFLDNFPLPLWKSDKEGKRTYVNKKYLNEYKTIKEKELGNEWKKNIEDFYLSDFNAKIKSTINSLKTNEVIYKRKIENEIKIIKEYISPLFNKDSNIKGAFGIGLDITSEKAYENIISKLNDLLEKIIQKSINGIFIIDSNFKVKHWNEALEEITGINKNEVLNANIELFYDLILNKIKFINNSKNKILKIYSELKNNNLSLILNDNLLEFENQHKNIKSIKIYPKLISLEEENLYAFFIIDYTNQQLALQKAFQNQKKFEDIFSHSSDSIVYLNNDLEIIDCNPSFLKLLEADKEIILKTKLIKYLLNPNLQSTIVDNQDSKESMKINTNTELRKVYKLQNLKNKIKYIDLLIQRFDESTFICFIRDISDIIENQNKLVALLKEKEVLLKEVHHRVKNNLQIVSSLINLQSSEIDNENLRNKFLEIQARIKAMAIIHELLYTEETYNKINAKDYLLNLISYLYGIYEINYQKIKLEKEIDNIELPIEKAITLGLIANEIITNAFKYAFPDNRSGYLRIIFKQLGNSKVIFEIRDNGIGMQETFNLASSKSLGMQLIYIISKQIKADFEFSSQNGCEYKFTFDLE